jgi:hypothetical protein
VTFKRTDAGRSKSKRPKQSRDCAVRSLATALLMNYDAAYTVLAKAGRKCNRGFDIEAWARKTTCNGFRIGHGRMGPDDVLHTKFYWRLQKMPWTKDHHETGKAKRYRISDFLRDNPHGTFIVSTAKHVFAVVDGVVHDDDVWHFLEDRPVYAWMELRVARLPLWQVQAVRRPIAYSKRRMMRRAVAIVEGASYKLAMKVASQWYEWALRKGEDMSVTSVED